MKIFLKFIASLIFFLSILVIYMSLVGFETKRFNSYIIKKVENINNDLKIELNEIKIILDPLTSSTVLSGFWIISTCEPSSKKSKTPLLSKSAGVE